MVTDINRMVVICLQNIQRSNQYIVHLKLIYNVHVNYISILKKIRGPESMIHHFKSISLLGWRNFNVL